MLSVSRGGLSNRGLEGKANGLEGAQREYGTMEVQRRELRWEVMHFFLCVFLCVCMCMLTERV